MKVTKEMLDKELQPYFYPYQMLRLLLKTTRRIKLVNRLVARSNGRNIKGLHCEELYIPSQHSAPPIRTRIFKPLNHQEKLPVMLYLHGGGYMIGSPEMAPNFTIIKRFIDTRPCIVVVPDYRKALTAPFPAAFNDCYDTLLWIKDNTEQLGIRDDRFIIAGHSAGGGLTAAVTLKARDTQDVDIAFQMPIYPMIDDRQMTESAAHMDSPAWSSDMNNLGWNLYLKDLKKNNQEIPSYAAPARNNDYRNFPPTITLVGEFEPARDETIAYVGALEKAGIPVTFKLYPKCFHAFDASAPNTKIAQDGLDFTYQNYAIHYDTYIPNQRPT